MIAAIPPELIAFGIAVVVIGVVAGGISLLVSRYGRVREDRGEAGEKVEAYERAILEADEREKAIRKERAQTHEEWKEAGRRRRKSSRRRKS